MPSALAAGSLPIQSIGVDENKELVIHFGSQSGAFPEVPHLLDMPGPNHRLVLDFAGAQIDKASLPSAEAVAVKIAKDAPGIKGLRFSNVPNAAKPTARIVVDLPENLKVTPRVVRIDESGVVIDLGTDFQNATTEAAVPSGQSTQTNVVAEAATTSGAPEPSAAATAEAAPAAAPVVALADNAAPPAAVKEAAATTNGGWDWTAGTAESTPKVAAAPAPELPPQEAAQASQSPAPGTAPAEPAPEKPAQAASVDLKPAMPESAPTESAPAAETAKAPESQPAPAPETAAPAAQEAAAPQAPEAAQSEATASAVTQEAPATPKEEQPADQQASAEAQKPTEQTGREAVKMYNAAVKAHLSGKLQEAIDDYKGALACNPSLAEAHSNLGLIYNQQHNYESALTEFRKALAVNPKDAITYNGIGATLRAQRDLPGAIKNWQTAVSIDPRLATAHYNLGTAYELQKDYDKAMDEYDQAVKNDYRLGEAYYRMGLLLRRKNRLEEAAEKFQKSLDVAANAEYSEDARQRLEFCKNQKTAKAR